MWRGLIKWRKLAGDAAANGLVIASIDRVTSVKQCRAIPYDLPLDTLHATINGTEG